MKEKEIEWRSLLKNSESIPKAIDGTIFISINNELSTNDYKKKKDSNSLHHRNIWVNGPNYNGMEDNDIRGFLDGRYYHAWNQPSQKHVRLGRAHNSYCRKYGEWELFRVLQRWDDLWLPKGAKVLKTRLELEVEVQVDHDLEILLYEVQKDWDPGNGGIDRNNISPADHGEVWWNEVGRDIKAWGLPGAGFASNSHSGADTPATPLAIAHYKPGDSSIVFESDQLTSYADKRFRMGKPLLFLLKLSDYYEDIPFTCIQIYSGNHGDSQNTARKPRLILDWEMVNPLKEFKRDILLEHNRSLVLPRIEVDNMKNVAISFLNNHSNEQPTISIRGGNDINESEWLPINAPQKIEGWSWLEVRIDAHVNPQVIGQDFTAKLKDTWVRTAPPEEQKVLWTFISPSNKKYQVLANYLGDSCWQVTFEPDELGRWKYYWNQNFTKRPYISPTGVFDVISGDRENAIKALETLIKKIRSSELSVSEARVHAFGPAFYRLQRELMRYGAPVNASTNGNNKENGQSRALIDVARESLVD